MHLKVENLEIDLLTLYLPLPQPYSFPSLNCSLKCILLGLDNTNVLKTMLLKSLRKTNPFTDPEEKEIFLPCLQSKIKKSSEKQILSLRQIQLVVEKNKTKTSKPGLNQQEAIQCAFVVIPLVTVLFVSLRTGWY